MENFSARQVLTFCCLCWRIKAVTRVSLHHDCSCAVILPGSRQALRLTLRKKAYLGTCSSKTPQQSLHLLGLVWIVVVQTMETWLGSCPCFFWASDGLGSDLPKVLLLPQPVQHRE